MAAKNEAVGFNIDLNELIISKPTKMETIKSFVDEHNTYFTLGIIAALAAIAYKVFGK